MRERLAGGVLLALLRSGAAAFGCVGDCNGDGTVAINEIVVGVNIALGSNALRACPSFDRDGDGTVTIGELLAAVNAALSGCPATATPTPVPPTPTHTPTLTPTPTPTMNQPPSVLCLSAYQAAPGQLIQAPLPATDPDGQPLTFSSTQLPPGAALDAGTGVLTWTPDESQIAPFFVGYTASDSALPPASATGLFPIEVLPDDSCTIVSCDPAAGCTRTLKDLKTPCCGMPPLLRPARPLLGCPQGAAVFVGANVGPGIGRLENCDYLRFFQSQQSNAQVRLKLEARCLDASQLVTIHVRLVSASSVHPFLFDFEVQRVLVNGTNGYLQSSGLLQFPINGPGPFIDLEQTEANLTVTVTDAQDVSAQLQRRLVLTSSAEIATDLPDTPDIAPPNPLASCSM